MGMARERPMGGRTPRVVVVGPVFVDMAVKCKRFPEPGETVEGFGFSCTAAGSGANAAAQVAFCGCESYLIGKVGDDVFGQMACETLTRNKVNTDFIYRVPAICTGMIVTMVDAQGENSSCLSQGANRVLSRDEVSCALVEQLISSADICLVTGAVGDDAAAAAIRCAQLNKTTVILKTALPLHDGCKPDPSAWPKEFFLADILVPDIISPAKGESGAGAVSDMKYIGTDLVARGLGRTVIRMGTRGVLLVDRQGSQHIEGFDYEPVDRTACDDAFVGALAAAMGTGDSAERAVKFAYAAEVLACKRFGSIESLPKKTDIIELLQNEPD